MNRPRFVLDHRRHKRARGEECPLEAHGRDAIPGGFVHLGDERASHGARVGDDHLGRTELAQDALGGVRDLVRARDVAAGDEGALALGLHLCSRLLELALRACEERHVEASTREIDGNRPPDAPACSRDDRDHVGLP